MDLTNVQRYTVEIPKDITVFDKDIKDIEKFALSSKQIKKLHIDQMPRVEAWYALMYGKDWTIPLQISDILNIVKIPWGKDNAIGLVHALSDFYQSSAYANQDIKKRKWQQPFSAMEKNHCKQLHKIITSPYNLDTIHKLQLMAADKWYRDALIALFQLGDPAIDKQYRKIMWLEEAKRAEWVSGKATKELYKEIMQSSHWIGKNIERECFEETGDLIKYPEEIVPYLIIDQKKITKQWSSYIKSCIYGAYDKEIDSIGTIKYSISEQSYDLRVERMSPQDWLELAWSKLDLKINAHHFYKIQPGMMAFRGLQHAPK